MRQDEMRAYFDQALNLKEGQVIRLKFATEKAAESTRVSLYREKAAFTSKVPGNLDVQIRRNYDTRTGMFYLILEQSPRVLIAEIVNPDGTVQEIKHVTNTPYAVVEDGEVSMSEDSPDFQRLFSCMKNEEGWSDEDMEEYCTENCPQYSDGKWKDLVK